MGFTRIFIIFIYFVFCLIIPKKGFSSEIDSFTGSCEGLPDLTVELNEKVNEGIREAVREANFSSDQLYMKTAYPFRKQAGIDYCNSQSLYRHIRRKFARTLIGQLESYINKLPAEKKVKNTFENSIYREFGVEETPTISGTKNMGAVIRIGDHIVGADKFGHFFTEGWSYFTRAYHDGVNIEAALFFGKVTESIYYGAITTGVYSYADLTANFNGMRFWNQLIGNYPDPITHDMVFQPYIKCKNENWVIERPFDWKEYIDSAWDERINYSLFRNKILFEKVKKQIELLGNDETSDCFCVNGEREEIKERLVEKYYLYEDQLLNLSGHGVLPEELKPTGLLNEVIKEKNWGFNTPLEEHVVNEVKKFFEKRDRSSSILTPD